MQCAQHNLKTVLQFWNAHFTKVITYFFAKPRVYLLHCFAQITLPIKSLKALEPLSCHFLMYGGRIARFIDTTWLKVDLLVISQVCMICFNTVPCIIKKWPLVTLSRAEKCSLGKWCYRCYTTRRKHFFSVPSVNYTDSQEYKLYCTVTYRPSS